MKKILLSMLVALTATSYTYSSNIIPLEKLMFHSIVPENATQELGALFPEYADWLSNSEALLLLNFISSTDKTVIVKFSADWCGPCKRLVPIVHEAAQECIDDVIVIEVNIDEAPSLREMFDVQSIPTLIYFKDGRQVDRTHGVSKESLLQKIKNLVDTKSNTIYA